MNLHVSKFKLCMVILLSDAITTWKL